MTGIRVGVDIGGTFTDLVFLRTDGRLQKRKVSSTPQDYAEAIVAGIEDALGTDDILPHVQEIVHATTVATNAILERRGARTALITTQGFRDVLELRRIRIPLSYDLGWEKPPPSRNGHCASKSKNASITTAAFLCPSICRQSTEWCRHAKTRR